jgi:hypothetical protein
MSYQKDSKNQMDRLVMKIKADYPFIFHRTNYYQTCSIKLVADSAFVYSDNSTFMIVC